MSTRTYVVFISYRHADNKDIGRQWATWLHHSLETYEVPPELVGRSNQRKAPVPHSLFPVFRDEEELPADADLSANIRRALDRSGLLVVICSPRAVPSQFVNDEIRYFKELGRGNRILALLIDGEPNAADKALECLPKSLRYGKPRDDGTIDWDAPAEPIAADARPEGRSVQGWTTAAAYEQALEDEGELPGRQIAHLTREYERRLEQAKLKIIAGALGVDLGELTRRNKSFELAKARRRARILTAWLTAVAILGIAAAAAGVIALRNQRRAEQQTKVATEQRDRALRESYVNVVRRAAEQVTAGRFGEARETLFRAPPELRAWEWWYLMARCGPAPMTLTEFAAVDGRTAAAMKARLDRRDAAVLQWSSGGIELRFEATPGRSGAWWHARRMAGKQSIVLNAFSTGMYGETHGLVLDSDAVFWNTDEGDTTRNRPPVMATGEQLADHTDYVAFLRERYIVGDVGPDRNDDAFIDLSTWSDAEASDEHDLYLDPAGTDRVAVSGSTGASFILDLKTSALTVGTHPPPPERKWDGQDIRNREGYSANVERGPAGPLVLSTWERGSVRLRDGRTGRVIGESLSKEAWPLFTGPVAAIVPGTEWIAGSFWWKDRVVTGVADLRNQRLLTRFERPPEPDPDIASQGGFAVSPDGSEAVLTIRGRNERYFAAWDVKTGKLLYGPFSAGIGEDTPQVPPDSAWHPKGTFVAIRHADGPTELRRGFASAPFARLNGLDPSGGIREIGDPTRVLIGNWLVDTVRWEPLLALPSHWISPDGNRAVIVNRPGIIEIVRPGFRNAPANRRELALLHQVRTATPPKDRPAVTAGSAGRAEAHRRSGRDSIPGFHLHHLIPTASRAAVTAHDRKVDGARTAGPPA